MKKIINKVKNIDTNTVIENVCFVGLGLVFGFLINILPSL